MSATEPVSGNDSATGSNVSIALATNVGSQITLDAKKKGETSKDDDGSAPLWGNLWLTNIEQRLANERKGCETRWNEIMHDTLRVNVWSQLEVRIAVGCQVPQTMPEADYISQVNKYKWFLDWTHKHHLKIESTKRALDDDIHVVLKPIPSDSLSGVQWSFPASNPNIPRPIVPSPYADSVSSLLTKPPITCGSGSVVVSTSSDSTLATTPVAAAASIS
jgi:hypothetical protein